MDNQSNDGVSSTQKLHIEFRCPCGKFSIASSAGEDGSCVLRLAKGSQAQRELGHYRAVNDAITAILRQETGCLDWDNLPPNQIPSKVHDIASWELFETTESDS